MAKVEVLFLDVLGTVVDWRGSIATEARPFLLRNNLTHLTHLTPDAFADAWVSLYDASVDPIRSGQRPFVPLDVLNRENLERCLVEFGIDPHRLPLAELENLNLAWHRLIPWPDSVEGISRLRHQHIVAPLSDGNTRLLVDMAKRAGLMFDTIIGADIFRAYKPMPEVYLGACDLLGVEPARAMLVAAHDYDLDGARRCGLQTALVSRLHGADPAMAGRAKTEAGWDHVATSLIDLADILQGHATAAGSIDKQ